MCVCVCVCVCLCFVFGFSTCLPTPLFTKPNRLDYATDGQTLYKSRLCRCKPRVSCDEKVNDAGNGGEASAGEGDDAEDIPARTAQAFSELMRLCRAWEKKDAALASLALEGALCCLRSLKGRPATAGNGKGKGKGGGDGELLEGALKQLAAAVGDFFGKKRGGGLTVFQVLLSAPDGSLCSRIVCIPWVCVSFLFFVYRVHQATSEKSPSLRA